MKVPDEIVLQHTIVNRGKAYGNMRCAVCSHLKRHATHQYRKVRQSRYWCPHQDCQAHVCEEHRSKVHNYAKLGIELRKYHNEKRIQFTKENPGKQNMVDLCLSTCISQTFRETTVNKVLLICVW